MHSQVTPFSCASFRSPEACRSDKRTHLISFDTRSTHNISIITYDELLRRLQLMFMRGGNPLRLASGTMQLDEQVSEDGSTWDDLPF